MERVGWVIDTARSEIRGAELQRNSLLQESLTSSLPPQKNEGGTVRLPDSATSSTSTSRNTAPAGADVPRGAGNRNKDKNIESDRLVDNLLRRISRDSNFQRYAGKNGDGTPESPSTSRTSTCDRQRESRGDNLDSRHHSQDRRHKGPRHRHRLSESSPFGDDSGSMSGWQRSEQRPRSIRDRDAVDKNSSSIEMHPLQARSNPGDVPAAVDRVAAVLASGQPRTPVGERERGGAGGAALSAADEDPFTEAMWESSWCRRVLDAIFFGPDSAIPAGCGEGYKELEEFVPKFLARRAKAAEAAKASTSTHAVKQNKTPAQATSLESSNDLSQKTSGDGSETASTSRRVTPAMSALPSTFHKRYLMNFTILTLEQQRIMRDSQRTAQEHRARDGRAGWREYGAGRRRAATGNNVGETALLRELSRQGLLEREEVKAMLRTGPLQDFRGFVLQAYIDFRMQKSLAKVIKIRTDRAALPITAYQDAIVNAVAENPCVLVAGDTGCGKSTQVPQFLLRAGYGRVACTQPRRISAMGLCRRVSYETLNEHGSEVAYQVRFDSSRRKSSRILFLTEGLLLRQIASDPDLSAYSVVIVDEVHERHAGCDFLLGLLRAVLRRRPDLKVVLMSATINPELFSRFFDGAPLIRVPGRMHPVEVRYVPTAGDDDIQEAFSKHDGEGQRKLRSRRAGKEGKRVIFDARPYVKLLESIDTTTPRDERGDLLVFLSGMSDMLAVSEGVREYVEAKNPRRWVVLMLHSSLSIEDQDKVFDAAPIGTRKMILATNIAESSVTIDGIRFVADSGKAKEMSWDPASGVRSLQEFWVSRASAEQRKGRAGRTGPGVCFRLYARGTFDRLPPFAEPEIRRCPLEGLVLQMKSLGLEDPRCFPYLSPPPPENLTTALEALALLGATDVDKGSSFSPKSAPGGLVDGTDGRSAEAQRVAVGFDDAIARAPLTPLGRVLSSLPVEPSVGKMLALASLFGESDHVLTLAAALSTQTPFDARSSTCSAPGANPVAEFSSPDGDPFTVMNAYDEWIRVKAARRESSRRWCKRRGLQEQRLYEMTKLRRQFEDLLGDSGLLWLGAAAERARRRGIASRGQGAGSAMAPGRGAVVSKNKLRELKMRKEGRRRKVLPVQVDVEGGAQEEAEARAHADTEEAERDLKAEVGEGIAEGGGDDALDLSSLEFYMAQDVDQLAQSSGRSLTQRDVAVIKAILCQGLYPNFAVADAGNAGRPSNERQYVTRSSGGLFMSPSSVLNCQDFGIAASIIGDTSGGRGGSRRGSATSEASKSASGGAAARAGRSDGLLCYGSLMETQKPFLASVTPLPALQALLLFSARIDTSEDASLMLFDHWLLVEIRGKEPALIGQKLLVVACRLRALLEALLSGALAEAERRRAARGILSTLASAPRRSEEDQEDEPQDIPPLLVAAKRAWLDGAKLGGRDGDRNKRDAGRREGQEQAIDWSQVAEDLSVELADFMLQPIGYDVKSVPPRQVEALVVDALRLADVAELRRVLDGARGSREGNPSDRRDPITAKAKGAAADGDHVLVEADTDGLSRRTRGVEDEDMPELLAALSRSVEEEVRGTNGLFGLETGLLERLKGGVRLTPFLRHGSLRRRDPDAAAPGGLAAGGLKKWWRCPRCNLSQVVDLEAIHEHFKVCLVDAGPDAPGRDKSGARGIRPGDQREGKPKRRRMLGTSVKTGRSHNLPTEEKGREKEG